MVNKVVTFQFEGESMRGACHAVGVVWHANVQPGDDMRGMVDMMAWVRDGALVMPERVKEAAVRSAGLAALQPKGRE
jgi:hypothetical protein